MSEAPGPLLIDDSAIAKRVRELGAQLSQDYSDRFPLLVGVSVSAAPFLADLARAMSIDVQLELIVLRPSSSASGMRFENDLTVSIEGRAVILVADIVQTGATLRYMLRTLEARKPASIDVCLLLDRAGNSAGDLEAAYTGFVVPDVPVVGYGLEVDGRHREHASLYQYPRTE